MRTLSGRPSTATKLRLRTLPASGAENRVIATSAVSPARLRGRSLDRAIGIASTRSARVREHDPNLVERLSQQAADPLARQSDAPGDLGVREACSKRRVTIRRSRLGSVRSA